jgi:hypothetical protein
MAATRWESHYYYFPKYLDSGANKECSEYSFTWECRELYDEYLKEHEAKLEENFNKADKDMCFICDEIEKVIGRPITYTVRSTSYRQHGNKKYIYITPRDLYPNKEDYELIENLFGDTIVRVFYPGLLPDEEFYWRTDPKEGYSYDGALWVPHPKVGVLRYDKTIFNNLHIKDFSSNNLITKEIVTLTPGKKYRIIEYGEETEYRLYPFGFNANGVATLQEHEKIYSWKDRIITSVTKSEEYFKAFLECAKEYANEYRCVVLKKEKIIQNLEKKMDIIMNS